MNVLKMSNHAQKRFQQRGFDQVVVGLVLMFGKETPAGDGCSELWLSEKGFKEALSYLQKAKNKAIVVNNEEEMVTCYVKHKRRKV